MLTLECTSGKEGCGAVMEETDSVAIGYGRNDRDVRHPQYATNR